MHVLHHLRTGYVYEPLDRQNSLHVFLHSTFTSRLITIEPHIIPQSSNRLYHQIFSIIIIISKPSIQPTNTQSIKTQQWYHPHPSISQIMLPTCTPPTNPQFTAPQNPPPTRQAQPHPHALPHHPHHTHPQRPGKVSPLRSRHLSHGGQRLSHSPHR